MDEETEREIEHCKNDSLRQLGELGHMAKELLLLKNRMTEAEYHIYHLEKRVQRLEPEEPTT